MKKKEIINFINNKNIIYNSKILPLYNCCSCNSRYEELFDELLKSHNDILIQYEKEKKANQEYNKFISSNICDHPIRNKVIDDDEKYWLDREPTYCYQCIFCKHKIPIDIKYADWFQKHYYNDCVYLDISNNEIFSIILEILNSKHDNDEIDFVKEFQKLNLENCIINANSRPENYVMLLYKGNCFTNDTRTYANELILLSYLSKLKNIRFQLISDLLTINRLKTLSWYAKVQTELFMNGLAFPPNLKYSYPEDLNAEGGDITRIFNKDDENHINFKLIINITTHLVERYKLEINNELNKRFPNNIIINIDKLDKEATKELSNYIDNTFNSSIQNCSTQKSKKLVRKINE